MFAHGETVTRLRAQTSTDRYSKLPVPDWSKPPTSLSIDGCGFDPGGNLVDSGEPSEMGRNAVVSRPTVYTGTNADITAIDRLVVRGITYEVDGNPRVWRNPFTGWEAGMVVRLRLTEG